VIRRSRPDVQIDRILEFGGWFAAAGWALDTEVWALVIDGVPAPVACRYPRPDAEAAFSGDAAVQGWLVIAPAGAVVELDYRGRRKRLRPERSETSVRLLFEESTPRLGRILDAVGWEPSWQRLAMPSVPSADRPMVGHIPWAGPTISPASRELRWKEQREARERADRSHPFFRDQPDDPTQTFFDNGQSAEAVLVTFAGFEDKLSVPAVEFFDAVVVPCRLIYVRQLHLPFVPHVLGGTVEDVAVALSDLVVSHDRVVFAGTSLGAYLALLYGTLCGADRVFALSPTTTVRQEDLQAIGDHRWDQLESDLPADFVDKFGDIRALWRTYAAPEVAVHFPYRNDVLRQHAERIGEISSVSLYPHYEHAPMHKILSDGTLTATLASMLTAT
jgi:hypothetical protein